MSFVERLGSFNNDCFGVDTGVLVGFIGEWINTEIGDSDCDSLGTPSVIMIMFKGFTCLPDWSC